MSQEKLTSLTMLSIENDMLKNININVIINDFASRNVQIYEFFTMICVYFVL